MGAIGYGLVTGNSEAIRAGLAAASLCGLGATPFVLFGSASIIKERVIPAIKSKISYKKLESLGLINNITSNGDIDISNRPELSELSAEIGRSL